MVKTRSGLKYEVDISEEDKKSMKRQPDEDKHTHIGVKVVEAFLIPSARNANNESNRTAILGYVHGQGHKVVEVKEAGFGRVD